MRYRSIAYAALMFMGFASCNREDPVFVVRVLASELLPQGSTPASVSQAVGQALAQDGFILAEGSKRNYVAKVELRRETYSISDGAADRWAMRVLLVPRDSSEGTLLNMEGQGESPADEAVPNEAQLGTAAQAAAHELAEQRRLLRKPLADLEKALLSDSRRVRDFAVRLAGARRMKEAVPLLSRRLTEEPEPDLQLRIVGALVQIGDARAVGPMVELTKRKHPVFINQIVFALASIGGGEAEAYLDTLAQGHPSDQVKAAAAEALRELLSRKSANALKP